MKTLFEEAIGGINELITIRMRMATIYAQLEKTKETTAMQFKTKNYLKWIDALKDLKQKNTTIKSQADIKALKLSQSLEHKLIELFENGEITDIDIAKGDLTNLERQVEVPDNLTSSTISASTSIANINDSLEIASDSIDGDASGNLHTTTAINKPAASAQNKTTMLPKMLPKILTIKPKKTSNQNVLVNIASDVNSSVKIDTLTIEAVPKILADLKRPTDPIGAAAYDLRFVHGIGEKNAEKMANEGITLELLMDDWNNWIKKNNENTVLMYSKMPIPTAYSQRQWDLMDSNRQYGIQRGELELRLRRDTNYLHRLLPTQLVGLKYFHDMSQKIPREEMQKIETILKKVAQRMNPDIKVMVCGSYRRGRERSGDVDCLITHPYIKTIDDLENTQTNILAKFVKVLTDVNFIIDHLTDFGKSKYMGFCIINQQCNRKNIARRIDIKFIPFNSYGAAILYFTGSKTFNTMMRTFAIGKGYKLNEYGLVRNSDGEFIPCLEEIDPFTILGYPYKKPEDRDI